MVEPVWLEEIEPATAPPWVRMGTRALGDGAWLLGGDDADDQLAEKRRILEAHHDEVVAALDGTEDAAAELLERIAGHRAPNDRTQPSNTTRYREPDDRTQPSDTTGHREPDGSRQPIDATRYREPDSGTQPIDATRHREPDSATQPNDATRHREPDGGRQPIDATGQRAARRDVPPIDATRRREADGGRQPSDATGHRAARGEVHPIDAAGRLVAEDLCLLTESERGGEWVLAAGSVCFPSHWRLTDKIGLPMAAVHGPVPDYASELAERVDRFLDRLRVGRGVWRRNWTVHSSPDLFAPDVPPPPDPPITVDDAGDRLWLRSERQTLTRLPRTQAIVFTIRTQQVRLATLAEHPEHPENARLRAKLGEAVAAWPPHQTTYRGGAPIRRPLLAWLRLDRLR